MRFEDAGASSGWVPTAGARKSRQAKSSMRMPMSFGASILSR